METDKEVLRTHRCTVIGRDEIAAATEAAVV